MVSLADMGPMADRPLPGCPTRKADIRALAAEVWDWSRLKSPQKFKVVALQVKFSDLLQ
jgi:hypothetical protein